MADVTDEQLAQIETDMTIRERISGRQSFAENLAVIHGERSGTSIGDADRRLLAAVPLLVRALRDARDENDRMASVLSDVFCEQTGGRLSYPTYDARTVNAEINDARQQEIDVIEAERDGWRKEAIARRRAFINLARGAQLNESRLRAGIDINGRARDCIQAERDELRERLAAVEQLCDASDEADLRPAHPDFDPIEIPWTVAVRAATAGPSPSLPAEQEQPNE